MNIDYRYANLRPGNSPVGNSQRTVFPSEMRTDLEDSAYRKTNLICVHVHSCSLENPPHFLMPTQLMQPHEGIKDASDLGCLTHLFCGATSTTFFNFIYF